MSFIRVLGSADWCPTANNDHSCYTIDDRVLIDACPSVVVNLLSQGVDPIDCKTICFTHMHADHCMGLAPLILYWRVRKSSLGELTLVGPKATLRRTFERALDYALRDGIDPNADVSAQVSEMPKLIELDGECSFETEDYRVKTMNSDHACPGLVYRFENKADGHVVSFTGDGRFQAEFIRFFAHSDLLVHEAGGPMTSPKNDGRHSSARDAINTCNEGEVRHLVLTHTYEPYREWALGIARSLLKIPVDWAMPGKRFNF